MPGSTATLGVLGECDLKEGVIQTTRGVLFCHQRGGRGVDTLLFCPAPYIVNIFRIPTTGLPTTTGLVSDSMYKKGEKER